MSRREILPASGDEAKRPYLERLHDAEEKIEELGADRVLEVERAEAERIAIFAERAALLDAARAGTLSEEALRELSADVDERLMRLREK